MDVAIVVRTARSPQPPTPRPDRAATAPTQVLPIHSMSAHRVQRIHGARHALVGVALATSGMSAWIAGTATELDVVGVVGGIGVLVAFLASLRRRPRKASASTPPAVHGVNWVDLGAAMVTAIEAWHMHHQGKRGLPIAYGVTGVLLLGAGLFHERLSGWRRLVLAPAGFDCRLSLRTRVRMNWSDIDQLHHDGTRMRILRKDQQVVWLDCSDALNAVQLLNAIALAASPHLSATGESETLKRASPPPRSYASSVAAVGRILALGFGLVIVPAAVWSASLSANVATSPRIPWSVLNAVAMLLALRAALRPSGSSVVVAGPSALRVPRQSLTMREWLWATTAAVGTTLAGMSVVLVIRALTGGPVTGPPDLRHYTPWLVGIYAGTGSVLAGVFEEVAFRGHMQAGLAEHWGRHRARWAVAGAFTLLHAGEPSFVWLAAVYAGTSLALSSLVDRCRSVWPGAVGHTVADVLSFGLWAVIDPTEPSSWSATLGEAVIGGTCAAALGRLAFLRVRASFDHRVAVDSPP